MNTITHTMRYAVGGLALALMVACMPESPRFVEVEGLTPAATPTTQIIYVTPTVMPSPVPTLVQFTPDPPTATPADEAVAAEAQSDVACDLVLEQLYATASDYCLGKPAEYFCNGGLPPQTEPSGPLQSAMGVPGALVEARELDALVTQPLLTSNSGGLMWLRLQEAYQLSALLIGQVALTDVTPQGFSLPAWKSITVETTHPETPLCGIDPPSALVLQAPYGRATQLVVNGSSIDLNGTMIVETRGDQTQFIIIEGQSRLTVLGGIFTLFAGQQLDVTYRPGDWTTPSTQPLSARPLEWERVAHLPVALFDRAVLLPQPGYVMTSSDVNMRVGPDEAARLLYQVPQGEVLSVLGKNDAGDWYHVRLGNGETGWMRVDLLQRFTGPVEVAYEATPSPPRRYGEEGNKARIVAGIGGNLRLAPDTAFGVIGTLPLGTEVEVLARSPYSPWVKVQAGQSVGWLALTTVETQASIGFLPVDYDVPLPPRATPTPFFAYGGGHAYPDPNMN